MADSDFTLDAAESRGHEDALLFGVSGRFTRPECPFEVAALAWAWDLGFRCEMRCLTAKGV
ncbi:MAG: hypothetical protein NVSMB64_26350 [Candidatus Velthaea sp.]